MSSEESLRAADMRVTRPRVAVLEAVRDNPHADTESLIGAVREDVPGVSHQAVYDSLRALTSAGLVRRIQPSGDNHHLVVCRSCGAIADVDCTAGDAPCLTASPTQGFTIDEAEVIFWGVCPECSSQPATEGTP